MGRVQEAVGIHGEKQEVGVYVHVPFCRRKCPYCDFKSVESDSPPEKRYIACLARELEMTAGGEGLKGALLATLYMGGGTPSILSPAAIARIIESTASFFTPVKDLEVTIEVNPDTVDPAKLSAFRKAGATRLSIGFQALDDRHLALLGRPHTAEAALKTFHSAREAGFSNAGVDLMFAIPGQTLDDWEATLRKVSSLRPEHVSLYGLTIEEGTPFHGRYARGGGGMPSEEEEARMYLMARQVLMEAGYRHYEISNFALPGFESRHNSRYWSGACYIGIGPAAHSYLPMPGWGRRWWNVAGPYDYMERVESGGSPKEAEEELSREDAMFEAVMLGLRKVGEGVDGERFAEKFGLYPAEAFTGWEGAFSERLIISRGRDMALTEKGLLFLNEVLLPLAPKRA